MRRSTLVDIGLATLIVISAGVIGYRALMMKTTGPAVLPEKAPVVSQGLKNIRDDQSADNLGGLSRAYGLRLQRLSSTHWQMDDLKWKSAVVHPDLSRFVVNSTKACAEGRQDIPAVYVIDQGLRANFEKNQPATIFDIGGSRCLKVGNQVKIIYMNLTRPSGDEDLDKPILEYGGVAQIEGLLQLNRSGMTAEMVSALGETKEFLEEEFFVGVAPQTPFTLIRLGVRKKTAQSEDRLVHFYPRTRVFSTADLKREIASGRSYRIIDVRSESEREAQPLPVELSKFSISVPLILKKNGVELKAATQWEVTHRQLRQAEFAVSRILSFPETHPTETLLIVVGATANDARPLWALKECLENGFESLAWYTEGVDGLAQ